MANETRDVIIRLHGGQAIKSIKELEGASRSLTRAWKQASDKGSRKKVERELQAVNQKLKEQRALISATQNGWEKVSGSIMKMGGLIAGMMGFQMITDQFGKMIQKAADLSDSLADVRKTTGMSDAQVQQLNKSLSQIDTRSSRKELLGLAYEAGKLGISGVKDVQKFVEQADKIKVEKIVQEGIFDSSQAALKLENGEKAAELIALYKLIANDEERKALSMNHTDITSNGNTIAVAPIKWADE
jgi:hypothetical protein